MPPLRSWSEEGVCPPHPDGGFPLTTRILTPYGPTLLGNLYAGSRIMTLGADRKGLYERWIEKVIPIGPRPVIELKLADWQTPLLVAPEQALLSPTGWEKATALQQGASVILVHPETNALRSHTIMDIDANRPPAEQVIIVMEGHEHTFIANGVVANRFGYARPVRTLFANLRQVAKNQTRGNPYGGPSITVSLTP